MTDFLLEILSEEIPAVMQKSAAENFLRIASETFAKSGLTYDFSQIKTFITPRRLALVISGLKPTQEIPETQKIGPKINADKKAIEGFLRSVGLSNESELKRIDNAGQACYAYIKPAFEIKTSEIIKGSLLQILQKMTGTWTKLMRWDVDGDLQPRWIRPIRNVACMLGSEVIDVDFAGLKSNNLTFGHFLKSHETLVIKDVVDYRTLLEKNLVILDQVQRKKKIIEQIAKITSELQLDLIDEEKSPLLDEVVGLCEWPTALVGSIDQKFLDLPDEVLILTLKLNQRYFCLKNSEGILSSKFIFVVNSTDSSNQKKIIQDNEKLVCARLSDAEFFISEDLKKPLFSMVDELKKVIFHQKLGSVYSKVKRLNALSKFLSIFIPHCSLSLAERSADLCKADLVTKAVAELPELQGKIGSFYAHKQKEDKKIVAAIYEHYLPLGPSSELPKTALGIMLSIADKMDSIVGFFLANEKPTSSRDPYALRRAALGIIRISFQEKIAFPIRILIEKSLNSYQAKLVKDLLKDGEGGFNEKKKNLVEEIIKFFVERLKVYLKENELLRQDIINAVIDEYVRNLEAHKYFDILYLAKKIKFLDGFVKNSEHQKIIELYKRSVNILAIEEKKDGKEYRGKPSRLSFKTKYERILYRRIKQISSSFKKLIIRGEFESAFKLLNILEIPLSHFFDHVMVNDEDLDLRENRLLLLSKIRSLFNEVADLNAIEV